MFEALGDEHLNHDSRMAHYKDLRELYAKSLEYHGIGYALFQPISANDMQPPCAGFFDRNGDFNMIARLSTEPQADGLVPLNYMPPQVSDIGISWKPKTSLGVTAITMDASGEGPQNVPASAEGHVRYKSQSSFGAVLIAARPVTLTGYNDERVFLRWLDDNRATLLELYGRQLRKYGMWIITRTHTAPGCWINAWQSKNREAQLSLKVKANMMAEAGNELAMDDSSADRDWTCYKSKDDKGIVVFMDGIEVTASQWYLESVKQTFSGGLSRSSSRRASSQARASPPLIPTTISPPAVLQCPPASDCLSASVQQQPRFQPQYQEQDHLLPQSQRASYYHRSSSQASSRSCASHATDRPPSASPPLQHYIVERRQSSPISPISNRRNSTADGAASHLAALDLETTPDSHQAQPRPLISTRRRPLSYAAPASMSPPFQPQSLQVLSTTPQTSPQPQPHRIPAMRSEPSAVSTTPTATPPQPGPINIPTVGVSTFTHPAANSWTPIWDDSLPDKDKNGLPDDIENDIDSQVLKDVGLANTMSRNTFLSSGSTEGLSRSASLSKSIDTLSRSSSPRTPGSLRREGRRISSIGDAK